MAEHPDKSVQTANDYAAGTIGNLDDAWTRRLVASVVDTESYGGNLDAQNDQGYSGRYQAGAGWLVEAGLVNREKYEAALAASGFESEWDWGVGGGMETFLNDSTNWNNDLSLEKYFASAEMQDQAFHTVSSAAYERAIREGVLSEDTPPNVVAGFLKARHLGGYEGAIDAAQGRGTAADINGTTTGKYYDDIARNNDGFDQYFVPEFERAQTYLAIDPMRDGMLEHGEHGEAVLRLQQALNDADIVDAEGQPLPPLQPDGDFGDMTRDALRQYQTQQGLAVDGKAGKDTLSALGIYDELRQMPAEAAPVEGAPVEGAPVEGAPVEGAPVEAVPVEVGGSNWPAPGNYTINTKDKSQLEGDGEFGTSRGDRTHKGIDINGEIGDPIESFGPGEVIFSGEMSGYGQTVVVQHDDGLQTVYAHLSSRSVEAGERVTEDTEVGKMGRTGNLPGGETNEDEADTHLHFEIRENSDGVLLGGTPVDPRKYLDAPPRAELEHGDQGADVRRLQEALNETGIRDAEGQPLQPDGDFGDATEEAVRKYQEQAGLAVDGVAGEDTLRALGIHPEQAPAITPPAADAPAQPPQDVPLPAADPPQEDAPPTPPSDEPPPPSLDSSVPPAPPQDVPLPPADPPQEDMPPTPPSDEPPPPSLDSPAPPVPPQEDTPPAPPSAEPPPPSLDSSTPPLPPQDVPLPPQETPAAPSSPPPLPPGQSVAPEQLTGVYQDGDRGDTVEKIQERLNERMGFNIPVDGIYGPLTEAAVKLYQHQNGLRVDGIAGPETLGKLNEPLPSVNGPEMQAPSTPSTPSAAGTAVQPNAETLVPPRPDQTAPQPGGDAPPPLQQGSVGADVAKLQTMLSNQGYRGLDGQPLAPSGIFDAATTHALKSFEKDHGLDPDGIADPKTLEALSKAERAPKLSNPNHPDYGLYQQAMKGLELLPAGTFKSAQERENAAAAIAFEAKVSGLSQIDHVKPAGNNAGFFAVQGALDDPANRRVYVDREQAVQQTVQQSTQLLQQAATHAPAQDATQQRENQSRVTMFA